MTALLEVAGLTTDLATDAGVVRAVENVSLHIGPGEAVALVGESGCGKSMTALSIMRLLPPYGRIAGGQVLFRDRDLARLAPSAMRRLRGGEIAMIFQDPMTFLNPLIRIGAQIAEAARLHLGVTRREAAALARDTLRRVRIPDADAVSEAYPHQLSGGMRQRVLIAIAIVCRPALLICDEPTTALDVTVQAQVMDLLHALREEIGSAILLISHDLGLVAEHCERVYVMYAGRVVESGATAALFAAPLHPYTRGLLAATLRADRRTATFVSIEGQPPDPARPPPGCRFHPRCAERFDRCAAQEPGYHRVGADRYARCHLHEPMP